MTGETLDNRMQEAYTLYLQSYTELETQRKSVEPKPLKYISAILPRNENKSITRENKTAVIQYFLKHIRWEQYLKSF